MILGILDIFFCIYGLMNSIKGRFKLGVVSIVTIIALDISYVFIKKLFLICSLTLAIITLAYIIGFRSADNCEDEINKKYLESASYSFLGMFIVRAVLLVFWGVLSLYMRSSP